MKPPVLIINSYAGSLTLAAKKLGHEIIGSYEDEGYGLSIQRENFPEIKYLDKFSSWPTQDLSGTIVLAHPPCAAFSQQNASKNARGTDAKKFQCTKNVLKYALGNKCMALAIESVPAALEGAREVHEQFATEYGYDIYRILQNPATFGIPQWRPRFWIIFIPKGSLSRLYFQYEPKFKTVGEAIKGIGSEPDPGLESDYDQQVAVLTEALGPEEALKIIRGSYGEGGLPSLLRQFFKDLDAGQIAKKYCVGGNFMSHCMRILPPNGFATTLLFDSWWICNGKQLTRDQYKVIMGFPDDYKFSGKFASKFREYLSRGVCPPVAEWILENLDSNIRRLPIAERVDFKVIEPGQILDLNIKKHDFAPKEAPVGK
jgi:site-specific DNA-cytosine methylase